MSEVNAIREKIMEAKKAQAQLQAQLQEAHEQGARDIAAQIVDMCQAADIDVHDVLDLVAPPQTARKAGKRVRQPAIVYCLRGMPERTYCRGRAPAWMREAMIAEDLDPGEKYDRQQFRLHYMEVAK